MPTRTHADRPAPGPAAVPRGRQYVVLELPYGPARSRDCAPLGVIWAAGRGQAQAQASARWPRLEVRVRAWSAVPRRVLAAALAVEGDGVPDRPRRRTASDAACATERRGAGPIPRRGA